MPSRLYPLYGFLMMYEATGQDALMRKTAESILQMQVKTPSAEAEMIKAAARECSNKFGTSLALHTLASPKLGCGSGMLK